MGGRDLSHRRDITDIRETDRSLRPAAVVLWTMLFARPQYQMMKFKHSNGTSPLRREETARWLLVAPCSLLITPCRLLPAVYHMNSAQFPAATIMPLHHLNVLAPCLAAPCSLFGCSLLLAPCSLLLAPCSSIGSFFSCRCSCHYLKVTFLKSRVFVGRGRSNGNRDRNTCLDEACVESPGRFVFNSSCLMQKFIMFNAEIHHV